MASLNRTDWGLLTLRVAVGGMAILHGLAPLRRVSSWDLSHLQPLALQLLGGLLEMICGALILAGLWMWPAVLVILVLLSVPLFRAGSWHAVWPGHAQTLFRMLVTFASALAGAGKAALSK